VTLALLGISPFLLAATPDSAGSRRVALTCGQTVTTSVTLTADVTGCAGYGLIAGANGITINLNGHTISGSGSTHDGLLDASFSSVVFENGTIKGFVRGVEIDGGSATIRSLRVSQKNHASLLTVHPRAVTPQCGHR